jgi:D-alanyl-D-alanine carboxypeptidase (penicillin-binding protein 5/6)
VKLGDRVLAERPLLALAAVEEAGLVGRAWDTIRLWIGK